MQGVQDIQFGSGYVTIVYDNGDTKQVRAIEFLGGSYVASQGDTVPDLTIRSLTLLTTLSNVIEVIIKTLVDQGLLDESLIAGYDMSYVLDTLKDDLNTDIGD
jgi:hypothetical protein